MADLPSDVEPLPVQWKDIIDQNYAEVIRKLSLTNDPNMDINLNIPQSPITGLEFSLLIADWKMALIFFLAGADPNQNLFEGFVRNPLAGELFNQMGTLRSEDGEFQPVLGFRGLQSISWTKWS
jgi:hypothetical protein